MDETRTIMKRNERRYEEDFASKCIGLMYYIARERGVFYRCRG